MIAAGTAKVIAPGTAPVIAFGTAKVIAAMVPTAQPGDQAAAE